MMVSQQSSSVGAEQLMQNCDLPPPMKVFSGSDQTVISSMNRLCGLMGSREEVKYNEVNVYKNGGENEKLELLKALRFSQSRAREAEKKAAVLAEERDRLSDALIDEAKELFAYRQWVRLLELQVSSLSSQFEHEQEKQTRLEKNEEEDEEGTGLSWTLALAFCFGIAGVGFAFGCTYLF
ncbi:hypothetical protein UlMin_038726 [Ulmus minor]